MSTRALPPRPDLAQLKIQAHELHQAHGEGQRFAAARIAAHHPRCKGQPLPAVLDRPLALADAQLVIAREYGFENWAQLKQRVEDTMIELGAKPDVLAAAALGRMDLLRALFDSEGRRLSRPRRHGKGLGAAGAARRHARGRPSDGPLRATNTTNVATTDNDAGHTIRWCRRDERLKGVIAATVVAAAGPGTRRECFPGCSATSGRSGSIRRTGYTPDMGRYEFLVETYRTERLKTLGVWSQIPENRWRDRPEPRARTPHEHMVHQCVSEDTWMRTMLGIEIGQPVLPALELRDEFVRHYAACSAERLVLLPGRSDAWFEEQIQFFEVPRSRAWVLTRRFTHTAHHRGQLTACIRAWGRPLYSTYGPTADTGGLPKNGARVIYPSAMVEGVLSGGTSLDARPDLPAPSETPVTERP